MRKADLGLAKSALLCREFVLKKNRSLLILLILKNILYTLLQIPVKHTLPLGR
jgi:hypothetical protein